jgi:hypothetical protein
MTGRARHIVVTLDGSATAEAILRAVVALPAA